MANFADVRGTLHKSQSIKKSPQTPDISRVCELLRSGAGGGTRTHTPLRITDFESVSSANSDTPAFIYFKSSPDVLSEKSEGHRGGTLKASYIFSFQKPL